MLKVRHTERLFPIWPSLLRMSLLTSVIPDCLHAADRISWSEMSIGRPVITPLLWVSDFAYSVSNDHCPKCEIVFSFLAWVEVWHRTVMPPWLFLVKYFMRSCPTELNAFAIFIGFTFASFISGEVITTRVGLHWEVLFI